MVLAKRRMCKLLACIVFGQCLALLNCATAVFSTLLADRGVHIPTTQSFLNYFLLLVVYGPVLWCHRGVGLCALCFATGASYSRKQ